MAILVDGPPIILIAPVYGFGAENVGTEIPATPTFAYTGGSATANAATGQSSFLGQVIGERDTEPFNACSGQVGPIRTRNPVNFAG